MSDPYEQTPHIVNRDSAALGKRCPGCGEIFQAGDAVVWVGRMRQDQTGTEAVVVHVQCTEPRQP